MRPIDMSLGELVNSVARERHRAQYADEILRRINQDPELCKRIDLAATPHLLIAPPESPLPLRPQDDLQQWIKKVQSEGFDVGTGMRDPDDIRSQVEAAKSLGDTWASIPDGAHRLYAKMEREYMKWKSRHARAS